MILRPEDNGVDCTRSQPHPLTDVAGSSFAYDAVACLYNLGITNGTSATAYSPADEVTREQMAAFIGRLFRLVSVTDRSSPTTFGDVSAASFTYLDIGCIAALGITTGTSQIRYSPSDVVTSEQIVAFLARLYIAIASW